MRSRRSSKSCCSWVASPVIGALPSRQSVADASYGLNLIPEQPPLLRNCLEGNAVAYHRRTATVLGFLDTTPRPAPNPASLDDTAPARQAAGICFHPALSRVPQRRPPRPAPAKGTCHDVGSAY